MLVGHIVLVGAFCLALGVSKVLARKEILFVWVLRSTVWVFQFGVALRLVLFVSWEFVSLLADRSYSMTFIDGFDVGLDFYYGVSRRINRRSFNNFNYFTSSNDNGVYNVLHYIGTCNVFFYFNARLIGAVERVDDPNEGFDEFLLYVFGDLVANCDSPLFGCSDDGLDVCLL